MRNAHTPPPSPTLPSPSRELSFADWHAIFSAGNVTPINKAWDYRRERKRKEWLAKNARPMPPGAA